MSDEASKTKKIWTETEKSYLFGNGIDIGCGNDPVLSHVKPFDHIHGDANNISQYVNEKFDFVFSSHCLEHMHEPQKAVKEWFSVLKPGGFLFVLVPDEDLYEQGNFPSRYNEDHKWTFTISKQKSWSPKSINVLDLIKNLDGKLISVKLQDNNYDYKIYRHGSNWWNHRMWRWFKKVSRPFKGTVIETWLSRIYHIFGSSFDQTFMGGERLAQIQFIVQKSN